MRPFFQPPPPPTTGDPQFSKSQEIKGWRCSAQNVCCLVFRRQEEWKHRTQNGSPPSRLSQHGCPLSWQTKKKEKKKEMDPSASCCTPPSLSFLPNSIPQCTCLVHERQGKRREGIPFDLDRHANVGGHATAMEHPTAQQHRGPGSPAARVSLQEPAAGRRVLCYYHSGKSRETLHQMYGPISCRCRSGML